MTRKYIEFHLASRLGVVGIIEFDHEAGKRVAKTPRMTLYTAEDADRLIAALRETRDALAGDAARPRDDGAVILDEKPRILSNEEWDYLARRAAPTAKQPDAPRSNAAAAVMLGDKLADKLDARDAAPTPRVRLTRAQREALECIITEGGWLMLGKIVKSERGLFSNLERRGLLRQEPYARSFGYALTPQGRTALAAAQRETDDARDVDDAPLTLSKEEKFYLAMRLAGREGGEDADE